MHAHIKPYTNMQSKYIFRKKYNVRLAARNFLTSTINCVLLMSKFHFPVSQLRMERDTGKSFIHILMCCFS